MRFHVKRFPPQRGMKTPAEEESLGYRALEIEKIPTATLVAWGVQEDRCSFLITEDLAGYQAGDKLIESGIAFDQLLAPPLKLPASYTKPACITAIYIYCHFFARIDGPASGGAAD